MTKNNKIISISCIVLSFELMLYELIKFVHVDVRKNLRCQVANWYSTTIKQVRDTPLKTTYYFFQEPNCIRVPYSFLKNLKQNSMVNTVKEFLDVTFQGEVGNSVIFTRLSHHLAYSVDSTMGAFANPAGVRIRNKSRFEYPIEYSKNSMMQNAVSDSSFVNVSTLWIINIKTSLSTMLVGLIFQVSRKVENILFKVLLEGLNINFLSLVGLEFFPSTKQVLRFDNFIK